MSFKTKYIFDATNNTFYDGNRYWFYHKAHLHPASPVSSVYKNLLLSATSQIIVWDPYYNHGDGVLFSGLNNNITLLFLFRYGCEKRAGVVDTTKLRTDFDDIKQYNTSTNNQLCLRSINVSYNKHWDFHDRFLIIDRTEVYSIGSSMGYYHQSKLATGIYKITDTNCKDFIIDLFDEYWAIGKDTEIPIQFI